VNKQQQPEGMCMELEAATFQAALPDSQINDSKVSATSASNWRKFD